MVHKTETQRKVLFAAHLKDLAWINKQNFKKKKAFKYTVFLWLDQNFASLNEVKTKTPSLDSPGKYFGCTLNLLAIFLEINFSHQF